VELFSPYWEADGEFGLGEVPPLDLVYTQVALGGRFGCALDVDGEIHCWGTSPWLEDFPDAPPGPFSWVGASDLEACGARTDGSVECWGTTDYPAPPPPIVQLEAPTDVDLVSVELGGHAACGVEADGGIVCWGEDPSGYLQQVPDLQ
jgi:hypothetical protein